MWVLISLLISLEDAPGKIDPEVYGYELYMDKRDCMFELDKILKTAGFDDFEYDIHKVTGEKYISSNAVRNGVNSRNIIKCVKVGK